MSQCRLDSYRNFDVQNDLPSGSRLLRYFGVVRTRVDNPIPKRVKSAALEVVASELINERESHM